METLPAEVKNEILEYLDDIDLARSRELNREFNELAGDERLWHKRVDRKYGDIPQICDSWRLTYRDIDKVRPRKAITATFEHQGDIYDVLTYPIDETRETKVYEEITNDLVDKLVQSYGPIVVDDDFFNRFYDDYLRRHEVDDFDPYALDPNNPMDSITINGYIKGFKDFVLNKVINDGSISSEDWMVTIWTVELKYF